MSTRETPEVAASPALENHHSIHHTNGNRQYLFNDQRKDSAIFSDHFPAKKESPQFLLSPLFLIFASSFSQHFFHFIFLVIKQEFFVVTIVAFTVVFL